MRCIYCAKNESEVRFNREHIIPQNIGGKLYFDDFVCVDCNSFFGSNVDIEILKLPEVLSAFESLKIPHNKSGILNRFYNIRGIMAGIALNSRAVQDGFEIIDQDLLDGSRLTSNDKIEEKISKIIHRDKRLKEVGMTTDAINKELTQLLRTYKKSRPGDKINWPKLGISLLNREDKIDFKVKKNDKINVERLISKIAFEFFFFVSYHTFSSNIHFLEPLYKHIVTGTQQKELFISRLESESSDYMPYHAITLELFGGHSRIQVIFFGKIIYSLIGPPISDDTFTDISKKLNCDGVVGILYEQDLMPTKKKFGLFMNDGSIKGIVNI